MHSFAFLICFLCLTLVGWVDAQFPRACTSSQSLQLRECCPAGIDGSKCGESQGRGICEKIKQADTNLSLNETMLLLLDERASWPTAFYDRACLCWGNYDGVDCSKCKAGYQGESCNKRTALRTRRNFTSLSVEDVKKFVSILDQSKRINSENYVILTTSYDQILQKQTPVFKNVTIHNLFVWMHSYVSRNNFMFEEQHMQRLVGDKEISLENRLDIIDELFQENLNLDINGGVDYAHESSAFLPWHRQFMLKWEAEIRELVAKDPAFALPYWDWLDNDNCDVCNDAMLGGRDHENKTLLSRGSPFSKWEVICTRGDEYMKQGQQCTGEPEGLLLRNPGAYDPAKIKGLPTTPELINSLRIGDEYDSATFDISANQSYRNMLEGFANSSSGNADPAMSYMHNAVHLYMNGTMSVVGASANDPIFVVHHSFVDSLFELWIHRRRDQRKPATFNIDRGPRLGHRPQDFMVPFFPLVRNRMGFEDTQQLGYVYDYIGLQGDLALTEGSTEEQVPSGSDQLSLGGSVNPTGQDFSVANDFPSDLGPIMNSVQSLQQARSSLGGKSLALGYRSPNHGKKIKPPNRRYRLRSRTLGEGGFSVDDDLNEIFLPVIGQMELYRAEGEVASAAVESTRNPTLWQKIKNFFANITRAFRTMTKRDIGLLVLLCALLLGCICMCACMCSSRSSLKRKEKTSGGCCCYGDKGVPEETFALLETGEAVYPRKKVVKGTIYSM
ncbi:tyrosinase-like [Clavelina lepadiformis]|uniref:tyrosinase-like n=1 Tax=Clavelina lepadiformis TaxID=159417 RepID=UPI004042B7F2